MSMKEITMQLYPVGLVAPLALAVLVAPLSANAQPPGKVFRVGVLLPLSPDGFIAAFSPIWRCGTVGVLIITLVDVRLSSGCSGRMTRCIGR